MIPIVIAIGIVSVVGYLLFFKSPHQSDCLNGESQTSLPDIDQDHLSSDGKDVISCNDSEETTFQEESSLTQNEITQNESNLLSSDQNPEVIDFPKSRVTFALGTDEEDLKSSPEQDPGPPPDLVVRAMSRESTSSDKISPMATLHEDTETGRTVEAITNTERRSSLIRQNTMYECADVVTFVSKMNVCFGIFKNPSDHMTHFYSRRIKGSSENDTSLELRNIAASLRVWGKQWERIHNIKYSLKNSDAFLNNSKERNQLEYQFEDCQNKFGCKITLQDFKLLSAQDRNVFSDLLDKIQNSCISEDDTEYFRLKDDSGLLNNTYFDL